MGQTQGDDCGWAFDAILGSNTFDTSNATPSSPEPDELMCEGTYLDWGTVNPDIWFKYMPTSTGVHTFTTCDSSGYANFDTSMVLYDTGCSNQVACNGDDPTGDTSCQGYYSTISYNLTSGTSYFIRIGGWNGDSGQGMLTITEDGGGGDPLGACCLDYGGGKHYCFESTRIDCIAAEGSWTKGALCSEITCGAVSSSIWYVNTNNPSPSSGTSWSTAFLDLQDALDVASSGDQIWVAQGVYYPSDTGGSNDAREASYRLIAGVEIYGGFAGNETDVTQSQPMVNQVHFSGDLNGDDGSGGDTSENAYHVFLANALDGLRPTLDGIYIHQGNADGSSPHDGGGAVKVMSYPTGSTAHPIFSRTKFSFNNANDGGAIAISGLDDGITLVQCVLANNNSSQGGAIRTGGFTYLDNCLVVANTSIGTGGAIYSNQGECKLINTTVVQNNAEYIGGIYVKTGTLSGTNNVIWGNTEANGTYSQLFLESAATWSGSYNCVQNSGSTLGGVGNIDANPRFVDEIGADGVPGTGDENFQLFQLSPCIDAGDNTVVNVNVDLIGNLRIIDDPYVADTGNNPDDLSGIVDMGAYEHNQAFDTVWVWSGSNSSYFEDPANWAQSGTPGSDSNVMFNGSETTSGYVLFSQNNYLNTVHITGGSYEFDLGDSTLTLRGSDRALRVDEFGNNASALFKGPGTIYTLYPIELHSGNISIRDNLDFYADLTLGNQLRLNYEGNFFGDMTNEGATVLPAGIGIGNLNIDGSFYNRTNSNSGDLVGTLSMDIAGYSSGITHDHLSVLNNADMTTAIELNWDEEFFPYENDSFDLMDVGYSYGNPTLIYNRGLPSNLKLRWSNPVSGIRGSSEALLETTGPILFEDSSSYALTATPSEIVVADFDGDGDSDVAMAVPAEGSATGSVVILLNDGMIGDSWQVTELAPIPVGINPIDIAVIDIDGDGIASDLVVANYGSTSVTVLTNDGSASFATTEITTDSSPKYLAVANYVKSNDGNEHDDVVVACDSFKISILENTTSFVGTTFSWEGSISIPQPADILPGDVTNDKDFDYVLLSGAADEIRVLNGNGTGSYSPFAHVEVSSLPVGSDAAEFVTLDFQTTRDGNMDIVTVNEGAGTMSVLMGDGVTVGSASTTSVGTSPNEITVSDFDNDGDEDFVISVIGATDRELLIIRNDTEATVILSAGDPTGTGDEPSLVDHGDINGDTLEDIVCLIDLTPAAETSTPAIGVYFNTTEVVIDCPADLDGDGSVAVGDILLLIGAWGSADPTYDLDNSGIVDVGDILVVISAWGAC